MRANGRWWSIWFGLALLAACASPTPVPTPTLTVAPAPTVTQTPPPKKPLDLTILHTNDVEGFITPCG